MNVCVMVTEYYAGVFVVLFHFGLWFVFIILCLDFLIASWLIFLSFYFCLYFLVLGTFSFPLNEGIGVEKECQNKMFFLKKYNNSW